MSIRQTVMQKEPHYVIDLTDEPEMTPEDTYELMDIEAIMEAELNRLDEIKSAMEVETLYAIHPTSEPKATPEDADDLMEMEAIMEAELNRLDKINSAVEVETLHSIYPTGEPETTLEDTYDLMEMEAIMRAELNRLDEINSAVEVGIPHSTHPTGELETTPEDADELMEMAAIMEAELNRLHKTNPAVEVETLPARRHAKSTGGDKKKKRSRKTPVPAPIQSRLHKVRNPENFRRRSPPKANEPKRNIRYADGSVDTVPIRVLKKSKTLAMLLKTGSTEASNGHILLVEDGDDIPGGELGIEEKPFRKFWTWAETANYDIKGMVEEFEMEDDNGFWRIYAHSCLFDLAIVLDCPAFKGKIFHHMEREKTQFLVYYNSPGDEVARQKEAIVSLWKQVKEKTPRKYITLNWSMDELSAETHEDNARGIVRI